MIIQKILFRLGVFFLVWFSAAGMLNAELAEQCRTDIEQFISRGYTHDTIDKEKAQAMVNNLYEDHFINNTSFISPSVTNVNAIQELRNDIANKKEQFCQTEINELSGIYGKTSGIRQLIKVSASGNCLSLLQEGFCNPNTIVDIQKVIAKQGEAEVFEEAVRDITEEWKVPTKLPDIRIYGKTGKDQLTDEYREKLGDENINRTKFKGWLDKLEKSPNGKSKICDLYQEVSGWAFIGRLMGDKQGMLYKKAAQLGCEK